MPPSGAVLPTPSTCIGGALTYVTWGPKPALDHSIVSLDLCSRFLVCPVRGPWQQHRDVCAAALVVLAKERRALFTGGVVLVDELVQRVEVGRRAAVHVVPPVADEVLLVEHGAVRAEEAVEVAVRLAHVEHLYCVQKGRYQI